MKGKKRFGGGLAGAAVALATGAASLMVNTQPAYASALRGSVSIVGETAVCESGTYTATSGALNYVIHESQSRSGNTHSHGTFRLDDVVLEKDGQTYYASGANTFTVNYNANRDTFTSIDTEKTSIVERGGGLVGRVNVVLHVSSDGTVRGFNFGTCDSHTEV